MKRFGNALMPVLAFAIALAVNAVIISLFGFSPLKVYQAVVTGAAGSRQAILQTLSQSTILILTGLSFTIAFKAGLINIGAEGQLYMGAIFGSIAGIYLQLPGPLHKIVVILVAMAAGGAWAMLAGYLKIKFNANEVISTIMLNTIAVKLCGYIVNYPLKEDGQIAQTALLRDTAIIARMDPSSQFNATFFATLLIVAIAWIIVNKTVFGYEMRVTGLNRSAALAAGIDVNRRVMASMAISGAIAGCAGMFQVMGINHRLVDGFSSGYGFSGVAVSALAGGGVGGVVLSGILFGAFKNGAMVVQRLSRVPSDFVMILQALVIVFVAAPEMFTAILKSPSRLAKAIFKGGRDERL